MSELIDASMLTLAQQLRTRQTSVPELVEACLAREETTRDLNAFNEVYVSQVRQTAKASQRLLEQGYDLGPLHGMPIAIKANIDLAGEEMHAGSQILSGNIAQRDALVVQRLKQAGALIIGSTNMHEFAWGGTTNNPHYGASSNPWDDSRIPAGSSGGSGVAASVRSALATLGTDTGGSIRLPASMNGITGLRPGVGRLSTEGIFPLATSLDTVGPLARYAEECEVLFNVLEGKTQPLTALPELAGLRIGLLPDVQQQVQPDVAAAYDHMVQWFSAAGARCHTLNLTGLDQAVNALVLINLAEPASLHAAWLAERPQEYGADVRKLLQAGLAVTAVEYLQVQRFRTGLRMQLLQHLSQVDVILVPTLPFTAPHKGLEAIQMGDREESVLTGNMRYNALASLSALPAISYPAGFDRDGMPIGMQLLGRDGAERQLLAFARCFQREHDYHLQTPTRLRA
ncbi:amidase [Pantoea sp. Acro-805]|uniref:Amidase n=1 Tax=Candidatus Pantoea formicae TaxID=2608355 RepID=A0ABX0QP92_9GAMM|nr:amidase [Pantoea formicae]MDF7649055.1 amidase [Erwiniaceae bacterium L1_54_3]NIE98579.1 amidase [Pantoea formicae]